MPRPNKLITNIFIRRILVHGAGGQNTQPGVTAGLTAIPNPVCMYVRPLATTANAILKIAYTLPLVIAGEHLVAQVNAGWYILRNLNGWSKRNLVTSYYDGAAGTSEVEFMFMG